MCDTELSEFKRISSERAVRE